MVQCPHCSKTFSRSDNLNRHIKSSCKGLASPSTSNCKQPISTPTASGTSSTSKRSSTSNSNQPAKRSAIQKTCQVCNIDIPAIAFTAHLNSLIHKNNVLTVIEGEDYVIVESAFKQRLISYRFPNKSDSTVELFIQKVTSKLIHLIKIELEKHRNIRVNMELFAEYLLQVVEKSEVKSFNSKFIALHLGSDLNETVDNLFDVIKRKMCEFADRDSGTLLLLLLLFISLIVISPLLFAGWALVKCIHLELNVAKYRPLNGSSYIKLPQNIISKHACLNIQNYEDEQCFKWCILSQLHPTDSNPYRVSNYTSFQNELDFTNIDFPVKLTQIKRFENQNDISVNVFGYDKIGKNYEIIGPLYHTSEKRRIHINLLLFNEGDVRHYCVVKDLGKLVGGQLSKRGHRKYICDGCFIYFNSTEKLDEHLQNGCNKIRVDLPIGFKKNIHGDLIPRNVLKFDKPWKKFTSPFVFYFDFETILQPFDTCMLDKDMSYTVKKSLHIPYSFGYNIKCAFDDAHTTYKFFRGRNASKVFVEWLEADIHRIYNQFFKNKLPMKPLTPEELIVFKESTECYICQQPLKDGESWVRYYDLIGVFCGAAHNVCNLNYRIPKFIPCICHNLSKFDAHLFIKELSQHGSDIRAIATTKETYISFSKHIIVEQIEGRSVSLEIRFIDSFRFLSSSLSKLAQNLNDDQCVEVRKAFPTDEEFNLIRQKGVFPYSFVTSFEKLDYPTLPSKAEFYDDLNDESISDEDYSRALTVWNTFHCETLGKYSDIYLQSDCLLLTDVFEEFRKISLETYELDPTQFLTAPSLSWDAMMKYTKVELELIQDIDILNFIRGGIRGGICQCNVRKAIANNKFVPNFDPEQPTSYIMYLDATNLYGAAMTGYLPYGGFEWVKDPSLINTNTILEYKFEQDVGYIFEVDLDYPAEIHDSHNDLPFCVENIIPPNSKSKQYKLITNLNNKEKYVIHYMNLQQALQNGLKLTRIHRILQFAQKAWLKPYIMLNTEKRNLAISKAARDYYKLKNNATYGKTLESVEKRSDIKLITHWENIGRKFGGKEWIAKPHFKNFSLFSENFAAIQMNKTRVVYDKPNYAGFVILELSKYIMYKFLYNHIYKIYGTKNAQLLYMDTDSFILKIQTDNFYDDIQANLDKFDTSNYVLNNIHNITPNQSEIGKMKDEYKGEPIFQFLGTGAKAYLVETENNLTKRAKGVKMSTVEKSLTKDDYNKAATIPNTVILREMSNFQTKLHDVYINIQNKIALSHFDNKRSLIPNSFNTLSWGHFSLTQSEEPMGDLDTH